MVQCVTCSTGINDDTVKSVSLTDGRGGCSDCAGPCDRCGAVVYYEAGAYLDDGSNDWWCHTCIAAKYSIKMR